jgi:SAM-dependent methyltransferase
MNRKMKSMKQIEPFNGYSSKYEMWFEKNRYAYQSELNAVKMLLPRGEGVEVGVGSGRFSTPFGIQFGVDPSLEMMKIARKRGIKVIGGVAEMLPFRRSLFDFILMVTTICLLPNVEVSLKEASRVLRSNGVLIIGFIDRNSPVGKLYLKHKEENVFYRVANFYTAQEIIALLGKAGFHSFSFTQTIFRLLPEITSVEPVKDGYGEGSFVVIRAQKEV